MQGILAHPGYPPTQGQTESQGADDVEVPEPLETEVHGSMVAFEAWSAWTSVHAQFPGSGSGPQMYTQMGLPTGPAVEPGD